MAPVLAERRVQAAFSSFILRARVQNHYKGLFVGAVGQQVLVAQWFRIVACKQMFGGLNLVAHNFFVFFPKKLKFFKCFRTTSLTIFNEGRRPEFRTTFPMICS